MSRYVSDNYCIRSNIYIISDYYFTEQFSPSTDIYSIPNDRRIQWLVQNFIPNRDPLPHDYIITNHRLTMNYYAAKVFYNKSAADFYMSTNVDPKDNFAKFCKRNVTYLK